MKNVSAQIVGWLKSDDLLRHSGILFSGMMVVHVCNVLYQMAVSRALPSEEYALLAAFLGVLTMIQRPLSTLTTGISHYSSLLQRNGRTGDVKRLLRKWMLLAGVPSMACGLVVVLFHQSLSAFLHLERMAPVVITGLALPALFLLPVLGGAANGLQFIKWSSASTIAGAFLRLGLGAGFVWFLYPACGWAMLGHGAGIYVSVLLLLLGLSLMLRGHGKSQLPLPSIRLYVLQSFLIQAAYGVLMNADVVLVKHYVPEDLEFAYAATLGRLVVFLPGAIVTAMFPKVASTGNATLYQRMVFYRSFRYTVLCVCAAVAGCFLFPGLLVRILFGMTEASDSLKQMIGLMAVVMSFSALLNVVVQFLLAQRRCKPALCILVFAGLYIAATCYLHATSWMIVWVSAFCNALALLVLFMYVARMIRSEEKRCEVKENEYGHE